MSYTGNQSFGRKRKLLASLIFAGLLSGSPALSEGGSSWTSSSFSDIYASDWNFSAAVYGWLPNAPVDITTAGQTVSLDEDLENILEALEFAFMGHFEANKGPLGFFVSPVYYKGDYDGSTTGPLGRERDFSIEEKAWLVNYGVSYDLGTLTLGEGSNPASVKFSPFVGATYFHDPIEVSVAPGLILPELEVDTTVEFNTPIVGLDTDWRFSEDWGGRLRAHYGGFGGISDVENTWEVAATVSYHYTAWDRPARWFAGWRFTHIEYDDGTLAIDVDVTGPLIGFGIDF